MKTQGLVSINDIVTVTGLSRSTIDRVLNKRPGVHPRTQAHVLRAINRLENGELSPERDALAEPQTTLQLRLIIQTGQNTFTQMLLEAVRRVNEAQNGSDAASLQAVVSRCDEETLELVRAMGAEADGLALVTKNTEPLKAALAEVRAAGKPVVALVSDLDAPARSAYVGIDNRAAGRLAGFLCGRCLERLPEAKVAVVVGYFAYGCHEDREIGFRALLRLRFPSVELVEVVKGQDSAEATREAALQLFKKWPNIAGLYNVGGGNQGLAQALAESPSARRPLFIGHELSPETEPLLRAGVIDFLITQDLEALVHTTRQRLLELKLGRGPVRETNHLPFWSVSEFNIFGPEGAFPGTGGGTY